MLFVGMEGLWHAANHQGMTDLLPRNMILVNKTKFMWCKDMAKTFMPTMVVGIFLSMMAAGCATNRDSYADKEAQRVIAVRNEMHAVYSACAAQVVNNPLYDMFWEKTIKGQNDERKLELLTLNKPVSRSYIETAKSVGKDFTVCDAQAFSYAKSISKEYAQSYANGSGVVLEVYVNLLNGKYKTYGELNQKLVTAFQGRMGIMQAANDKLADEYLAASKAEDRAEQQRRAEAIAVFGAMTQGYASGYQQGQQNYQNAYQAPKTTNCRYIGSYLNCQSY